MLGKLLKYEFKAVGRIMLPLYAAVILFSVIFAVSMKSFSDLGVLNVVLTVLFSVTVAATIIMTLVLIIQRFYKNLLGNEGYLMFTLPVTTGKHITNKTISAAAWVFLGCIVGCISVLLICMINAGPGVVNGSISDFFHAVGRDIGWGKAILYIIEAIVIALICCGEGAVKLYAAIAVGHQLSNHRALGAIGAYIGFGIIEVILVNCFGTLLEKVTPDNWYYRLTAGMGEVGSMQTGILIFALAVIALLAIYWFVTWKLLDKRLNLQ